MKTLLAIVQLIPALIEMIKAVEAMWPEGSTGSGKEKLEAVENMLSAAYEGITDLWPSIESIISVIVSVFNSNGTFDK
jgi:predicted ATPase